MGIFETSRLASTALKQWIPSKRIAQTETLLCTVNLSSGNLYKPTVYSRTSVV